MAGGKAEAKKTVTDTAAVTTVYPKFVAVEQKEITSVSKSDGIKFRVVSYNILAQAYVRSGDKGKFPHSPAACLKEKTRAQVTLDVLKNLDADILCLQELDNYDNFYKEKVGQYDYSSIYVKRGGTKKDGCGIFYKHNNIHINCKFVIMYYVYPFVCLISILELVIEEKIHYNDLAELILDESTCAKPKEKALDSDMNGQGTSSKDHGDPNDPYVRLKRDCVGIMAAFKFKEPYEHYVIVENSHIYWDPEWADVKLAHAKYLLSREHADMPVYQYLISGMAEPSEDLPMPLCSVYACIRVEPKFTNYTHEFTATIDYILFSPIEGIKPIGYLELPEEDSVSIKGGLPNHYHPSDHLPIGAEFVVV
ncbi:DNAse I-like superfamily protein [Artemisia annua]|uniref:DNAse I-like superfamily protein n=1 Tax=Artemisia annua TaxID=35608 RepID=A0A2U1LUY4_ARTAN|nr:DNAse I-like superfamily protein [Artemisia annua]